jgi:hypothetical protein
MLQIITKSREMSIKLFGGGAGTKFSSYADRIDGTILKCPVNSDRVGIILSYLLPTLNACGA